MKLMQEGKAYVGWSQYWQENLQNVVLSIPAYQDRLVCQNTGQTRVFSWSSAGSGLLDTVPLETDFPLRVAFRDTDGSGQPSVTGQGLQSPVRDGTGLQGPSRRLLKTDQPAGYVESC